MAVRATTEQAELHIQLKSITTKPDPDLKVKDGIPKSIDAQKENAIAEELKQTNQTSVQYNVFVSNFSRILDEVEPIVNEFARKAFEKSLISKSSKGRAEYRYEYPRERGSTLLIQILSKIENNDCHFDTFLTILRELNVTQFAYELKRAVDPTIPKPDSEASGAETSTTKHSFFRCLCGNCNIETYYSDQSKCREQQKDPFPCLVLRKDTDTTDDEVKRQVKRQLIREANNIIREFQNFFDNVFETLKQNGTLVEDIIDTIFSFGQEGLPKPIQDQHGDKLETITTISGIKVFLVRHKYISFINSRILEKIIDKHCQACKEQLDRYLEHFKDFSRRNIFEIPASLINSSSTSDKILVVKVIDEVWFGGDRGTPKSSFTLNDIEVIQDTIAELIEFEHGYMHLLDISAGCILLTFEFLSCQEAPIFPLTTSQLGKLIRRGIIVLYQPEPHSPATDKNSQTQEPAIQSCTDVSSFSPVQSSESVSHSELPAEGSSSSPPSDHSKVGLVSDDNGSVMIESDTPSKSDRPAAALYTEFPSAESTSYVMLSTSIPSPMSLEGGFEILKSNPESSYGDRSSSSPIEMTLSQSIPVDEYLLSKTVELPTTNLTKKKSSSSAEDNEECFSDDSGTASIASYKPEREDLIMTVSIQEGQSYGGTQTLPNWEFERLSLMADNERLKQKIHQLEIENLEHIQEIIELKNQLSRLTQQIENQRPEH